MEPSVTTPSPYVSWCVQVTNLPSGTHVAHLMIMRNTYILTGKLYKERKLWAPRSLFLKLRVPAQIISRICLLLTPITLISVWETVLFVDVTTCDDTVTMSAWPLCYINETDQGLPGLPTAKLKNYLPAKQNYTFLFFFAEVVVWLAKFSQFEDRNNLKFVRFWRLTLGTRVVRAVRFLNSSLCWST
jgi:hypothetical protein